MAPSTFSSAITSVRVRVRVRVRARVRAKFRFRFRVRARVRVVGQGVIVQELQTDTTIPTGSGTRTLARVRA